MKKQKSYLCVYFLKVFSVMSLIMPTRVFAQTEVISNNTSYFGKWGLPVIIGFIAIALIWYFISSRKYQSEEADDFFEVDNHEVWRKGIERRQPKIYKDGTYLGQALGHHAPIRVSVKVDQGHLKEVTVLDQSERTPLAPTVFSELGQLMIDQNNAHVDVFTGATVTSTGFIQAVYDALSDRFEDGVYEGESEGYAGTTRVKVNVVNGQIEEIDVLENNDHSRTSPVIFEQLTNTIIAQNRIDVDVVSGATSTSHGFLNAIKVALGDQDK